METGLYKTDETFVPPIYGRLQRLRYIPPLCLRIPHAVYISLTRLNPIDCALSSFKMSLKLHRQNMNTSLYNEAAGHIIIM